MLYQVQLFENEEIEREKEINVKFYYLEILFPNFM